LRKKRPVVGLHRDIGIPIGPKIPRRDDLDYAQTVYPIRVIQREPVCDAPAAVMSKDMCRWQAQRFHHGHDIRRHLTFAIGRMIGVIRWCVAVAIPAQIRDDHVEMFGQCRGN
jgi:hypothetical protein